MHNGSKKIYEKTKTISYDVINQQINSTYNAIQPHEVDSVSDDEKSW